MKRVAKQDENICKDCKFFCQHFRKWGKGYYPVACGHCYFPKIKQRVKDQTCKYWTERPEE